MTAIVSVGRMARLEPAVVDVWSVGLRLPPSERPSLAETLSMEERARAARFHFDRDRERFTAARGWLRRILGSYCGRPPGDLVFTHGPRGKPALASEDGDRLRFNLAHSSGRALIAVTRDREVGVDLEDLQRATEWERVARRFFAAGEVAAILGQPAGARRAAFFACWTRKEAYAKARGDGLALPFDAFEVSVDPADEEPSLTTPSDPDEALRWSLHSLRPAPGFMAALAVSGREARLRRLSAEAPWSS